MFHILSLAFLDNSLVTWLLALGTGIVTWIALGILRRIAVAAITRITDKTAISWDNVLADCLQKTSRLFLAAVSFYVASRVLDLPPRVMLNIWQVTTIMVFIQVGLWLGHAISSVTQRLRERSLTDNPTAATSVSALGVIACGIVWILIGLLILSNLGIEIAPLIAGLGIGGLAVALAVQTVLKDLLASVSIILDKPFVVGDFLIVDDHMGSVEHIGIKTTRLRSLSGEQLVFANGDLLESRIRNFGRMRERRVAFTIGVTYQTTRQQLQEIPGVIRKAIESQKETRFDRCHFKGFGDSALDFETVYYVAVPDMTTYMDVQQAINLDLLGQFEQRKIEFAYPTRTLFLEGSGNEQP